MRQVGSRVPPMAEPCPICNNVPTQESYGAEGSHSTAFVNEFRPFCSKRCKLLDLSRWLSEDYRVAGEPAGDGAGQFGYSEDEDL